MTRRTCILLLAVLLTLPGAVLALECTEAPGNPLLPCDNNMIYFRLDHPRATCLRLPPDPCQGAVFADGYGFVHRLSTLTGGRYFLSYAPTIVQLPPAHSVAYDSTSPGVTYVATYPSQEAAHQAIAMLAQLWHTCTSSQP